jgi:glucose-6-phosphate isomerase
MSISFDPRNLMDRMVGEAHGLSEADVVGAKSAALNAVASFRKSYEAGKYGFPDLPNDKGLVNEIGAVVKKLAGSYDTVCVVGIGGSALGCWALDCGLRGPHPVQAEFTTKNPRLDETEEDGGRGDRKKRFHCRDDVHVLDRARVDDGVAR